MTCHSGTFWPFAVALEHHLNRGSDGYVVHRSSGKVGIELDAGVFFQHDYGQVEGQVLFERSNRAVVDDTVVIDGAAPVHVFPL